MKEGWKCAAMECGEQSVTEDTGTTMIHLYYVNNWDIKIQVRLSIEYYGSHDLPNPLPL